MLQPGLVAAEHQVVAHSGLKICLQPLDQSVVLVAHRGMRVLEDGLGTGGDRLIGEVLR